MVKRIFQYLKGTSYGLMLSTDSTINLTCFTNADWTSSSNDKKSTDGFCIFLSSRLISWHFEKCFVSKSNTKAEYCTLANVVAKIACLRSLLHEL